MGDVVTYKEIRICHGHRFLAIVRRREDEYIIERTEACTIGEFFYILAYLYDRGISVK